MRAKAGLLVLVVALAATVSSCADSGEQRAKVGDIEVTGATTEDLGVATSITEFLNRGCKKNSSLTYEKFSKRLVGSGDVARALRRYYLIRYGDLLIAYQSILQRCVTYESIGVADDEITVSTSLNHQLVDTVTADDTCRAIRASHVADTVPGDVLDVMGDVLATCDPTS